MAKTPRFKGIALGFRSGLEESVSAQLDSLQVSYGYESNFVEYEIPARGAKYTPDFFLTNGIVIETKGRFLSDDRKKHLLVKKRYPDLDLRFVFSNSKSPISKGSKTTYAAWCDKHGFQFADKLIPIEWVYEEPTGHRISAMSAACTPKGTKKSNY